MPTAGFEDGASLLGVGGVDKDSYKRNDPFGLHVIEDIRRHDSGGHSAASDGGNDVAEDVVLETFLGQRLGEADLGEFGSRVIALAKASKQTSSGGSVDDTTELLFSHVWPCSSCALVGALDMNCEDQIPVLVGHVLEADVSKNAGIVEQDVDSAKGIDGSLDDTVAILDAIVVGNSLTAGLFDLIDNKICSLRTCENQKWIEFGGM
jgi:hypothetical protein